MRLSRKVWAIVALSIMWLIGASIYTHNVDVERAESSARFAHKVCVDGKKVNHDPDLSSCDVERAKTIGIWMQGSNGNVAVAALVPIPFAWLAVFILVYVIRAQMVGFRAVVPWATLTLFRKAFVVVCVLFTGAVIFVGIVAALNLYLDTQVPVGLSSFLDVTNRNNSYVTVEGTWRRTDLTNDTIANPLQTSKIVCDKQENRCTEAVASVAGSVLTADVVGYDIQSWTPDAIVLRREYLCAVEVFTIDLNTNAVTGAGHPTNEASEYRKTYGNDSKKEWGFQLSKGFDVYWGLRQKARPLPLRVIQAMFGN